MTHSRHKSLPYNHLVRIDRYINVDTIFYYYSKTLKNYILGVAEGKREICATKYIKNLQNVCVCVCFAYLKQPN